VALPDSGGTVSFKYDSFGRRIEKVSPTATSIFVYDGNNLVQTVNSTGGLVARYAQTTNIDEPLAMQRGGTTDFYEADGLGSVTSLTDTTGAVAQTYTYDSFGNATASTGSLRNYFQYTGREFDTETNLYYYRARYYDPNSGRFLSEDPLRFLAGVDFFRYADNNPVFWRDASGLTPRSTPPIAILVPSLVVPGLKLEGNLNPLCQKGRNLAADGAMLEESIGTRIDEVVFYSTHPDPNMRALAGDPGHLQRIENEAEALERCKQNEPECEKKKEEENEPEFSPPPEWSTRNIVGVTGLGLTTGGIIYVIVNYWWVPVLAF